jgi:hypothetical protein
LFKDTFMTPCHLDDRVPRLFRTMGGNLFDEGTDKVLHPGGDGLCTSKGYDDVQTVPEKFGFNKI